ncbi:MAG: hypothetical protein LBM09_00520 [Candidatus Nomurabacteria bacterium]|jgi:hypothetical protein|nr:hypothetical protein [Candidatus Nomurabacteria bacterium]
MIAGGVGGANTQTGAVFENDTDFANFLATLDGYKIIENDKPDVVNSRWKIIYQNIEVGEIFRKKGLYRYFAEINYDWTLRISKSIEPDDAIFVIANNTVFIVEKKYQEVEGSVDEKLQTCDFKRKQYLKLFAPLNKEVEYCYLLRRDFFDKPKYKDVLDYIVSVSCQYYFDYIPLRKLGLPVPISNK